MKKNQKKAALGGGETCLIVLWVCRAHCTKALRDKERQVTNDM